MPVVPTSVRRLGGGAALSALLTAAIAVPAGAWEPARRSAERRPPTSVSAEPAAPPVRSVEEALAAGGRRADGGRSRTVTRRGIDVSHWQGYIRWGAVKRSGVRFVIAKATEGTWMKDRWYARNKARAQRNGLHFTAYHFANPSRKRNDAIKEADWFVRHAKLGPGNLIPALDLEVAGGLTPKELSRWTLTWLRRVERKLGVKPMIYTSPGFWRFQVGDTREIARAGFRVLWLSHWQTRRPTIPARRWSGHGWTIWQWTDRGRINGITGYVDRNIYSGPVLRKLTIREVRRASRTAGAKQADRSPVPQ